MRSAGVVALVGNTFLSQELVRIVSDHMDCISEGERFDVGGWIRLSGAAWPATWIYWASHIWTLVAIRDANPSSRQPGAMGREDSALTIIVLLEIILIHSLVLMFRGSWHLWPTLLW